MIDLVTLELSTRINITTTFIKIKGGYQTSNEEKLSVPNGVVRLVNLPAWVVRINNNYTRVSKTFTDIIYDGDYKKSLLAAIEFLKTISITVLKKGFRPLHTLDKPNRKSDVIEPNICKRWVYNRKSSCLICYLDVFAGKLKTKVYVGSEHTYTEERYKEKLVIAKTIKQKFLAQREAEAIF